jgi:type VI secretion system secreted protein Hcp
VHKGDIQIDSFALAAQAPGGAAGHGSGAGAGKATIQSFTITKPLDSASPLLFQAAASGRSLKLATLYFDHKLKGKQQDYLEFKMSNVLISGVSDGQTAGGKPTEQVSFTFQKITETFLGSNGKVSETVGVNVSANSKI